MHSNQFQCSESIYDLVCGNLDLNMKWIPEPDIVKNEFCEGGPCGQAYSRMLDANSQLCRRLDVEEWADKDVETIITELRFIEKHIALKMFEYGFLFGRTG